MYSILDSSTCFLTVQLYGPTCFAPVIRHVARIAASSPPGRDYYVLLIITDGIITGGRGQTCC